MENYITSCAPIDNTTHLRSLPLQEGKLPHFSQTLWICLFMDFKY